MNPSSVNNSTTTFHNQGSANRVLINSTFSNPVLPDSLNYNSLVNVKNEGSQGIQSGTTKNLDKALEQVDLIFRSFPRGSDEQNQLSVHLFAWLQKMKSQEPSNQISDKASKGWKMLENLFVSDNLNQNDSFQIELFNGLKEMLHAHPLYLYHLFTEINSQKINSEMEGKYGSKM